MSDTSKREELIEVATWALIDYDTDVVDRGVRDEHYRERRADVERVWHVFEQANTPTDDEREALASVSEENAQLADVDELAEIIARAEAHPQFPKPANVRPMQGDLRAADAILAAGFRRTAEPEPQGEPTDAPKRLAFEVNQMLSSVASHGPAALTATRDPMYTTGLLRRLRDAVDPAPRQYVAASDAVRAVMARHGLDVHRMVYGQPIASVLAREALRAALRAAAATQTGEQA